MTNKMIILIAVLLSALYLGVILLTDSQIEWGALGFIWAFFAFFYVIKRFSPAASMDIRTDMKDIVNAEARSPEAYNKVRSFFGDWISYVGLTLLISEKIYGRVSSNNDISDILFGLGLLVCLIQVRRHAKGMTVFK